MIRIRGLAIPYDRPNSYGETIKRGAIPPALFFPCNTHLLHEGLPVGVWKRAEDRADGLYVEGEVPEDICDYIKRCKFNQLSSSLLPRNLAETRFIRSRAGLLRDPYPVTWGPGDIVDFKEISFVDAGAYPGTWWRTF